VRCRATAVLIAGLLSLAAAAPAWATFPGRNGPISFNRFVDHDPDFALDLFSVNPNGGGLTQLTTFGLNTGSELSDHSPDGRRIAFHHFDIATEAPPQIWTADADGRHPGQLTAFAEGAFDPGFSPDGRMLAIDTFVAPDPGIFLIPAASRTGAPLTESDAQRVTRVIDGGFDSEPQISPDGRWIVFTRYSVECADDDPSDCQTRIFKVRTNGKNLTQLTGSELNASAPDWHPTGLAIAFDTHDNTLAPNVGHIMVMLADGSHKKIIVRAGNDSFYNNPSFSPDGTRVTFTKWPLLPAGDDAASSEIWTATVLGTGQRRLTSGDGNFDNKADWGAQPKYGSHR
jgi:Tol biopolymer transport system component